MRTLDFYIIVTADGMYADAEGGIGFYDPVEDEHRYANDLLLDSGAEIMGRRMYDVMEYWDTLDIDDPATSDVEREFAERWRETPKVVISRGQPTLRANSTLLDGDIVTAIRDLKAGDGANLALGCGAELLATLSAAGLIDRYRLLVTPTVLGQGKAIFGSFLEPLSLRLVGTRTFSSGAVLLEYVPAG